MKKYGILTSAFLAAVLCGAACAQPEGDVPQQWKDETVQESLGESGQASGQDLQGDSENGDMGENGNSYDVSSEQGRTIQAQYGSGEYDFNIQAEVFVPSGEIKAGTLKLQALDISAVENYVCGGESLHFSQEQQAYVSDGNSVDNDLSYDLIYQENGDGTALFENYRITSTTVNDTMLDPQDLTREQQEQASAFEADALELIQNLGLNGQVSHFRFSVGNMSGNAVFINTWVDGAPLIMEDYAAYAQSVIQITEDGVAQMNLNGLYEPDTWETVSVMSLDEVLSMIEEGVASGDIYGNSADITGVELAYFLESSSDGTLNFHPVWCFSGELSQGTGRIPFLCINAQTGEIDLMTGY